MEPVLDTQPYWPHNDSLSVVGLQFAIAQYSRGCTIHYDFNQLKIQDAWEHKVTGIQYYNGDSTFTATAIIKLV